MTKRVREFRWQASERPQSYWLQQATLAVEFARKVQASDLNTFLDAMRDAADFMALAEAAH